MLLPASETPCLIHRSCARAVRHPPKSLLKCAAKLATQLNIWEKHVSTWWNELLCFAGVAFCSIEPVAGPALAGSTPALPSILADGRRTQSRVKNKQGGYAQRRSSSLWNPSKRLCAGSEHFSEHPLGLPHSPQGWFLCSLHQHSLKCQLTFISLPSTHSPDWGPVLPNHTELYSFLQSIFAVSVLHLILLEKFAKGRRQFQGVTVSSTRGKQMRTALVDQTRSPSKQEFWWSVDGGSWCIGKSAKTAWENPLYSFPAGYQAYCS